jgi:thiamine biosynthesis lipoprotein
MTPLTFRHEAMATFFEIAIAGHPETYARQAAAAAFRELDRLEGELSRYVETSDIARVNRLGPGDSTRLGPDAFECLLLAADAALATGRAFDPSYATGHGPGPIAGPLPFTLDPTTHTLTSVADHLHLDLGAIGKGFALDRMADVLREWSLTTACLNSGGSTVLALDPPHAEAGWPIGIGDGAAARVLLLHHTALSGSGVAVKGSHIANPRTGTGAIRETRTWAMAASASLADALSTAFFVMLDAEVAAFCTAHPRIGAAIGTRDGRLHACGILQAWLDEKSAATS